MNKKYYAIKKYYDVDTNSYKHNILIDGREEEKIKGILQQKNVILKGFNRKDKAVEYLNKTNVFEEEEHIKPYEHIAYIDGSYNKDTRVGSYCGILLKNNTIVNIECGKVEESYISNRNLSGELLSVISVLRYCSKNAIKEITIYFDCLAIITNILNEETNKDSVLIRYYKHMCKKYLKNIKVSFIHVKSHKDNKYNILVDFISKNITLAKKNPNDRNKLKNTTINIIESLIDTLKEYLQEDYCLLEVNIID